MAERMKISVIVPIYNAEKNLEQCVDSIIHQSYSDMQIILVNDGSTDKSENICKRYADIDNRVLYIAKSNGGLVSARKEGVLNANGDFIGWVDADDWVEKDYFADMAAAQNETAADIVCATHYHDIGKDSRKIVGAVPIGTYEREDLLPYLLYGGKFFEFGIQPHVWSKLFRRNILLETQLKVDERIIYGEDVSVTYPSILKADRVCVTDITGYHYVQRQHTMAKKEFPKEEERLSILFRYMKQEFDVSEVLESQLNQYKKYAFLMRQPHILDQCLSQNGEILMPYGGIDKNSRVILYGAGVLGQKIYYYLKQYGLARVVLWVDNNYEIYQSQNMEVYAPKEIKELSSYDLIVIANSSECIAAVIIESLCKMEIPRIKIRWLASLFIDIDFRM